MELDAVQRHAGDQGNPFPFSSLRLPSNPDYAVAFWNGALAAALTVSNGTTAVWTDSAVFGGIDFSRIRVVFHCHP